MIPWWVEREAEQHLLGLREILVRCDENLKAHTLLQDCAPYFLDDADHPQIRLAREHQAEMVAHITGGPDAYAAYYEANAHERPFEEQYGVKAEQAHKAIPRVGLLREKLEELARGRAVPAVKPVLLDCACNDGWMAANLTGIVDYHGLDLNPSCINRAKDRHVRRARFVAGDIHQATQLTADIRPEAGYDITVCFEVLEHVPDPARTLDALVKVTRPGGRIFLSTPNGAVEAGDLPRWWQVEPKGHVRVFTPDTFHDLLAPYGDLEGIYLGPDQVLVAQLYVP